MNTFVAIILRKLLRVLPQHIPNQIFHHLITMSSQEKMAMLKLRLIGVQMLLAILALISMYNIAKKEHHHGRNQVKRLTKISMKFLDSKQALSMKLEWSQLMAQKKHLVAPN